MFLLDFDFPAKADQPEKAIHVYQLAEILDHDILTNLISVVIIEMKKIIQMNHSYEELSRAEKCGKNYSGQLKSFSTREHFILNALAPSLKLDYEAEELPISVKPDKQVSVTDVMALLRETYEGTPLDMTQNLKVTVKDRKTGKVDTIISPKANPWMRGDELNMLNGIKKGVVKSVRNIAVPQCAYSTVIQLRNWLPDAVGGVYFSILFLKSGSLARVR